jgi:flagellar biogenesis protein FliO
MIAAAIASWALLKVGLLLSALLVGLAIVNRRLRHKETAAGTGRVRLTPQHAVHIVEIEGRRLVIGTGPTGAPRLITDLSVDDDLPEPAETRPGVGWDGP